MDDLVARDRRRPTGQLTVAALQGNAGAGGVFLALAADRVWARDGVVLNPHYKGMGNLYGSEYWTYLLPRRVGAGAGARRSRSAGCRMGVRRGGGAGPRSTRHFGARPGGVPGRGRGAGAGAGRRPGLRRRARGRSARARAADEAPSRWQRYRAEELERMKLNFYGFDPSYHVARYHFVHKVPRSRTPLWLARAPPARGRRNPRLTGRGGAVGVAIALNQFPPGRRVEESRSMPSRRTAAQEPPDRNARTYQPGVDMKLIGIAMMTAVGLAGAGLGPGGRTAPRWRRRAGA